MDISIIIVNYNISKLLKQCLESIYSSDTKFSYEVFVVDNNSPDDSVEMVKKYFSQVKLIANKDNPGFSKANNQAIKQACGKYILLLNPDTKIRKDTLDIMIKFLDNNHKVGIAGCKVIKQDGKLDLACRRSFPSPKVSLYRMFGLSKLFPKSRTFARYNLTYLDENKTYEVDSVMGAFLIIKKEVIDEIGLLDENFFAYGEDIDWCYRTKKAGWKVYYYPKTYIIHYKGSSSKKRPEKMINEFYRAMHLFYDKHYAPNNSFLVNKFIHSGISLMALKSNIQNWFRKEKFVSK